MKTRSSPAVNALDMLTDDVIFSTTSFLATSDLVSLALTCRRLGGRPGESVKSRRRPPGKQRRVTRVKWARAAGALSLAERIARRHVEAADGVERGVVPSPLLTLGDGESWMHVHARLCALRTKEAVFHRLIGEGIGHTPVGRGASVRVDRRSASSRAYWAVSGEVMTRGRHYAEFRCSRGLVAPGLVRPVGGWDTADVKWVHKGTGDRYIQYCNGRMMEGEAAYNGAGHCLFVGYKIGKQTNHNFNFRWGKSKTVGFLLDLDRGTLGYYEGGKIVHKVRGLTGHFCWAVSLGTDFASFSEVKITNPPIPGGGSSPNRRNGGP